MGTVWLARLDFEAKNRNSILHYANDLHQACRYVASIYLPLSTWVTGTLEISYAKQKLPSYPGHSGYEGTHAHTD